MRRNHRWAFWWKVPGVMSHPEGGSWRLCTRCRIWKPPTCVGRPMPPCEGEPHA